MSTAACLFCAEALAKEGSEGKEGKESKEGTKSKELKLKWLDDKFVLAPAGPYSMGIAVSAGIGFFFAHQGRITLFVGRHFWNRLDAEISFHLGSGKDFLGLEVNARLGVLLHVSRRWDVMIGWRVGYAFFRIRLPGDIVWTGAVTCALVVELRFLIKPDMQLRLAPVVAVGYWNHMWGFMMEPGIGLAYRF